MHESLEPVKVTYTSDVDEEFLLADVEIGGIPCFQVLKRSENGPVLVAFFRPENREEVLVDAESFIDAIRKAVAEIRALKL